MVDSNKYLLQQEVILQNPNKTHLWEKTLLWINKNKWEITQINEEKNVKFKHVISSVRSYAVHKIEIIININEEIDKISFNVFTNSKYPAKSIALRYKEVLLEYINYLNLDLPDDELRNILKRNELNRLIQSNFFGIIIFNIFTLVLLEIAFIKHFLIAYLLGVSFFALSIPSIRDLIRYNKLKNRIYNKN